MNHDFNEDDEPGYVDEDLQQDNETASEGTGVCTDNLNAGVAVMKSAQDGA
jgi:hypothetical protein